MKKSRFSGIYEDSVAYYTKKLEDFGQTPAGVDWNGSESQCQRFAQLSTIVYDMGQPFSLNDLGCGYGALVEYLDNMRCRMRYRGFDISEAMVQAARSRYEGRKDLTFLAASEPDKDADYTVASGIFNVRQDRSEEEWHDYILDTIQTMNARSRLGFAFNCLTSYSDKEKMRAYLHYSDPCVLFDYCKRTCSRHVALLHDYGLYEFTIVVKKSP